MDYKKDDLRSSFLIIYYSYNGNLEHNFNTLSFSSPLSFLSSKAKFIISAISFISSSFIPRVVTAGVPIHTPLVTNGLSGSKGIVFLLAVIPISSSMASAFFPVNPLLLTSISIR